MVAEHWSARPTIPGLLLIAMANLWMLATCNISFWGRAYQIFGAKPVVLALFGVGIWAYAMIYLLIFANRWLLKPFLVANMLIAAAASYYHESMGIIIDREMIQNILSTTSNESRSLLTGAFIQHIVMFGILPSLAVMSLRVSHPSFLRSARNHLTVLTTCIVIFSGAVFSKYQSFSFGVRQSPGMRQSLQPVSTIQSLGQYAQMLSRAHSREFEKTAPDAHKGAIARIAQRPTLTVLVIGETLRDRNWGLSGYERNTAPELERHDILAFSGVESCGTSTSVSLPCMFSKLTRQDFSYDKAVTQENLLDVLARVGYDVEWWDANTGDMGVAERVAYQNFNKAEDAEFCSNGECNDGILFKQLQERAGRITKDTVIVLHQIGNHGPAYYERYPETFARFLPDCRDADLTNCAPQHIINAYDNAVTYTDHVLSQTIDFLSGLPDVSASLIYVSDHGESLGEKGLYLHAAPYWISPEEQRRVPMVIWMSDRFKEDMKLNYACVAAPETAGLSHDNFFHSVLGMLDVATAEKRRDLDLFASCRSTPDKSGL